MKIGGPRYPRTRCPECQLLKCYALGTTCEECYEQIKGEDVIGYLYEVYPEGTHNLVVKEYIWENRAAARIISDDTLEAREIPWRYGTHHVVAEFEIDADGEIRRVK